jgi:hypothetical protein
VVLHETRIGARGVRCTGQKCLSPLIERSLLESERVRFEVEGANPVSHSVGRDRFGWERCHRPSAPIQGIMCLHGSHLSAKSSNHQFFPSVIRCSPWGKRLSIHQCVNVCVPHECVGFVAARTQNDWRMETVENADLVVWQVREWSESNVSTCGEY